MKGKAMRKQADDGEETEGVKEVTEEQRKERRKGEGKGKGKG